MKVNASRTRATHTTSGSSHRFHTINITIATTAVTTIFTTVSDNIDPTKLSELNLPCLFSNQRAMAASS
jgi:hypothetical protein